MSESKRGKLLSRELIFDGSVIKLSVDTVCLPDGTETQLEMIRHVGAAAVVPLDGEGNVLMVRQFRHATGGFLLEVPAGKLDPGESPETCATRETEEETGYRPTRLSPLGWIWTTPGFTDEKIWLFLATGLEVKRQQLQPDEVLTVTRLPLRQAVAMALSGDVHDAKSVCALVRAEAKLSSR